MEIDNIHNAFSPAREIFEPEMFVGRQNEIREGLLALQNIGGFIAIYGPRGVGKSSIALQLKLIAEGDVRLPKMLDLERYVPKHGFEFLVHYVRCDHFVHSVGDLLKRILFGDDQNPSLFSMTSAGERKLDSIKKILETNGSVGLFGTKVGARGKQESSYSIYISDDMIQQFRKILGTVRKNNLKKSGLLILIDEFDIIQDKHGIASIVKACSSDYVKFGIIGIAHNIAELIHEHGSIGRQIDAIRVRKMDKYELELILRRAEYKVHHKITFNDDVKDSIVMKAEGFPYFVHLLGKEAMLLAFERKIPTVDKKLLSELAEKIVTGRLPTIYEDTYCEAIKDSPQTELLLKAFAENDKDEINANMTYNLLKDLGVKNPSKYVNNLTSSESGQPVLVQVRSGYFRFSDPVFRVYARIRQWEF